MKKILLSLLLFSIFNFQFSIDAYGACSPPSDYSSCPAALLGPKIAGNIDPKNYQQIRQQYNSANPSLVNQRIPVTIIYTTADLAPGNLQNLANNLRAMQQYGLQPIIRIASSGFGAQGWAPITTAEAAAAAQTLNQAFSQVNFAQVPVVYFGNEPNLAGEWGGQANALSFAQAFAAFISAAGAQRNFLIFVPPVATHQGGVEYAFMQQILNYLLPNGQSIAQSVNGAALTIYNGDAQSLSALYQQLTQFYRQNGINNFVISEIGPLVNGQLLQNQNQVNQWAQIMSGVFAAIYANPGLFGGAQYISTSFFLDTNGDGNPDVTLLVIIDKDGKVIIMNLLSLGGGIMTTPVTCQADQPFPGGAETKGESFPVRVTSCFGAPTDPAKVIEGILKTTKLDFPDNEPIAEELKEPLDKLKPYNYVPQVLEQTALGRITYDVCEEGTTNWYLVEKQVEFKTPAWVEKMATEGKELASWLAPGGGLGSVMGEQTQITNNLEQITNDSQFLAANQVPQAGGYNCSQPFYMAIENISYDGSQINYGVRFTPKPGDGNQCHLYVNGKFSRECVKKDGSEYLTAGSSGGLVSPVSAPSDGTYQINASGQLDRHWPCGFTVVVSVGCQVTITNHQIAQVSCGGVVVPPPPPRKCEGYIPKGNDVVPEVVCVGGECVVKRIVFSNPFAGLIGQIAQALCPSKIFIVTPKVRTPFVQSADTFLREQTLSIFKVPSADAEEAFEFEHALENAQHQFAASPASTTSSATEIYGQRGVKDSYDWVQDALTPPGY